MKAGLTFLAASILVACAFAQVYSESVRAGAYRIQISGMKANLRVGDDRVFKIRIYPSVKRKVLLKGYKMQGGLSLPSEPGIRLMAATVVVDASGVGTVTVGFPRSGTYELALDITPAGKKPIYTKFKLKVRE